MDALKNRLFTERISTEHRAPSCSRAAEPNPVIDRITVVPRESVQGDVKEQRVLVQQVPVQQVQALVQQVLTQSVPLLQAPVEPSPKWCPDWLQVLA
jgi:hypothetical protein